MATKSVVSATYKTIQAILEANDVTWIELAVERQHHIDREFAKLQQRKKELEDQVFHFTKEDNK